MNIAQEQPKVNTKAAIWTISIHAILLLLFYFINYNLPESEPVQELGIEVNLGNSTDGFGTDQPLVAGTPTAHNASATTMNNASSNDIPANILESNDPNAPEVNSIQTPNNNNHNERVNSNRNSNSTQPVNTTTNAPQQQGKYLYEANDGTGGNNANTDVQGDNEGNTTGAGDRGVPGGTPGANNYEGTPGSGGGISHTLNGRNIVAFPPPNAEFSESGRVTIRVTVNRSGIITNKRIVSASNAQLRAIALQKIESIRFNKSDSAPEEQFGNITFVFKTRS